MSSSIDQSCACITHPCGITGHSFFLGENVEKDKMKMLESVRVSNQLCEEGNHETKELGMDSVRTPLGITVIHFFWVKCGVGVVKIYKQMKEEENGLCNHNWKTKKHKKHRNIKTLFIQNQLGSTQYQLIGSMRLVHSWFLEKRNKGCHEHKLFRNNWQRNGNK